MKAGDNYVRRRFPELRGLRRRWMVYRLFVSQGRTLIDRGYAISGAGKFDMRINGYEQIEAWSRDPKKGFVLLTAHMGNWQIAMTALELMKKRVALVMRPEDNPSVHQNLALSAEMGAIRIVSPEQFLGGVLEVLNLLKEGYIVAFMGDRAYGFPSVDVKFLGDTAKFPYGAFQIAASAGCPVVVFLSARLEGKRYDVDVSKVMYPRWQPGVDKKTQLRQWVQEYADVLDDYSRKHPLQCFMFHDVWAK